MKILLPFLTFSLVFLMNVHAQDTTSRLPFESIEAYPANYQAGNIMARMIDGLGYRYYWATEGLRQEDLDFKPSEDARSAGETIHHLFELSQMIALNPQRKPNIRPREEVSMTFEEKRAATLTNLQIARDLYAASSEEEIEQYAIIFQRGERTSEASFWHIINGPISDAIYHVGQIVSFRRTSGNPMNPKVNVFMGKNRE
ncbi:MAG: hypothetical protein AAF135_01980 [Bacteroidota bacterium]